MRRHFHRTFLILAVFLLGAPAARAELRLSEILSAPASDWDADGTVDSKLDEWVEIVNTGPDAVDLQDLYLRDGTGTAWHYGFSGVLEAGGILLVTGADALQWQTDNAAGTSGLSLNNSGDLVELVRAPEGGAETLIDNVIVPAHAAASDRALAWHVPTGAWILHDALGPYGGDLDPVGTGCMPSPGEANTCTSSVPVDDTTVGRMKAIWEN